MGIQPDPQLVVVSRKLFRELEAQPGVDGVALVGAVPPQNPVDRTIVDVSALGIKLTYLMLRLLYALLATGRSSLKPRRELALRTLASRQQLPIVLRATSHRATHP